MIDSFFEALKNIMVEMSFYLFIGFLFTGILHVYVNKDFIVRQIGKDSLGSVIKATLLGIPIPICSCGVIPTGLGFYKSGASKGATVSFLTSTPQTGVDSILITYGLIGLPFAIIRVIAAIITGVFGGQMINLLKPKKKVLTESSCASSSVPPSRKISEVFKYGLGTFLNDVTNWLIVGILLAAIITIIIPDNLFSEPVLHGFGGMILMLIISIPMYICASGSVPIAASLMLKGLSPGAALVLLMAGPATNIATMTVLGKVLGKKETMIYLFSIILGALVVGGIIDYLLPAQWFSITQLQHHTHGGLPKGFKEFWAVVMTLLLLRSFALNLLAKWKDIKLGKQLKTSGNPIFTLSVKGMGCGKCKAKIENHIQEVIGVTTVRADLSKDLVYVEGTVDRKHIAQLISKLGYDVE